MCPWLTQAVSTGHLSKVPMSPGLAGIGQAIQWHLRLPIVASVTARAHLSHPQCLLRLHPYQSVPSEKVSFPANVCVCACAHGGMRVHVCVDTHVHFYGVQRSTSCHSSKSCLCYSPASRELTHYARLVASEPQGCTSPPPRCRDNWPFYMGFRSSPQVLLYSKLFIS